MLSFLAERDVDGYVPGITNIIEGGYQLKDGTTALSAAEKIERGKTAIGALAAIVQRRAPGTRKMPLLPIRFCRRICHTSDTDILKM